MTRDDIYNHLAQVYLGKRANTDKKKKQQMSAWLVINIFITVIIFASAFYGLTAFLTSHDSSLQSRVIFSLHNGPIRIEYDLSDSFSPVETFVLDIPAIDAAKYNKIQFSIRGKEEGAPGKTEEMKKPLIMSKGSDSIGRNSVFL
jgi:flagellar basal body-associated protein FliL